MLRSLYLCLLLLMVPVFAAASEVSLDDVIQTLEVPFQQQTQETAKIKDFQAEFSQESHISSINRVQRGEGSVRFRFVYEAADHAPVAKFRWDYRQPNRQEIISDGHLMWVYLPDNKQVIQSDIRQINDQQGENPVTFLSGLGNLSRDFMVDWDLAPTDQEGNFLLMLKPRKESPLIQQMKVVVNKDAVFDWQKQHITGEKFPISATVVTDQQGNQTAIMFHKIKVNQNLDNHLFTFNKPDDVEIVTPEQMTF